MKSIAFRFSKEYFPNAFLEHPSFSVFISRNSFSSQACMVNMAKRRQAFLFSGFHFPVFNCCLSPHFFHLQGRVLWLLLLCSILCSPPFYGLVRVESLNPLPCDFSGSQIQLLAFRSILCLSNGLLPAILSSLWSIFGKKMACAGKKSFQTAKPAWQWKQKLPRN